MTKEYRMSRGIRDVTARRVWLLTLLMVAFSVPLRLGVPLQAQATRPSAEGLLRHDSSTFDGSDGADARAGLPESAVVKIALAENHRGTLPLDRSSALPKGGAGNPLFAEAFAFSRNSSQTVGSHPASPHEDEFGEESKPSAVEPSRNPVPPDFNRSIYYKNKLEFGLDVGWLPINIPFAFDFLLGDGYTMTPLKYTLVPVIASVRWQMDDVRGPLILRGNWDLSFSGSVTAIPRGPETRYFSYIMGIRRNFVPRKLRIAPYVDGRLGLGDIDAKGPHGFVWAQGQDFTFTMNLGGGVRYNFGPKYSLSAGMNYMHISNLYLSEPRYKNYGINVYGPMVGMDIRLGKHHRDVSP
jgi:hypothetical protein